MKGKKYGGRVAGTPNKATAAVKSFVTTLLNGYMGDNEEEFKSFKEDWAKLSPKDRIFFSEKFAQYIAPKMSSVDVDAELTDRTQTTTEKLAKLSVIPEE